MYEIFVVVTKIVLGLLLIPFSALALFAAACAIPGTRQGYTSAGLLMIPTIVGCVWVAGIIGYLVLLFGWH